MNSGKKCIYINAECIQDECSSCKIFKRWRKIQTKKENDKRK